MRFQYLGFGVGPNGKSPGRRAAAQIDLANMTTSDADTDEENAEKDALLRCVEARDLMEFGLIPEFCGKMILIILIYMTMIMGFFLQVDFRSSCHSRV